MRIVFFFLVVIWPYSGFAQKSKKSIAKKNIEISIFKKPTIERAVAIPNKQNKKEVVADHLRISTDFKNYFGRYVFFKDIYPNQNEIIIPIDINVWQKDDGTDNFIDNALNRTTFRKAIENVNRIYTQIAAPSDTLPWVKNYPSTKIHFVLMKVYFNQCSVCNAKGKYSSYAEGQFLNEKANALHPEGKNHLKIHFVGHNARHGGYSTFPTYDTTHQHFVITANQFDSTSFKDEGRAWPLAMHLAHELGHNLDLYHTYDYSFGACNQNNPDYLDDVYGRGKNAKCPQQTGWDCDPTSPKNTCTNNVMGGTSASLYFSPKQVLRMHRALMQKSIGKYAIPFEFNKRKKITITKSSVWDFDAHIFTNIDIAEGDTLTIRGTIHLAPFVTITLAPKAVLIIDGGTLTGTNYFPNNFWKGIIIEQKRKLPQGKIKFKNGGKIEKSFLVMLLSLSNNL